MTDTANTPAMVVAVMLAAGGGTRFDATEHKLLAEIPATRGRPPEPILARSMATVAEVATSGLIDHVVVVAGATAIDDIVNGVRTEFGLGERLSVVDNPRWEEGQAKSLRVGIDAAASIGTTLAVVGLADQPDILATAWAAVIEAALADTSRPIAAATYGGHPRNPVALRPEIWSALPAAGDRGARHLIRLRPELVTQVPSSGSPADIDTVEDLRRWPNN